MWQGGWGEREKWSRRRRDEKDGWKAEGYDGRESVVSPSFSLQLR